MSQGSYIHHNCYGMLEDVRTDLNEYSTAFVQGSDTSGAYDNTEIIRKLNIAQKYLFNLLFVRFPDLFYVSSSVSGSSGVYTLPSDLARLSHVSDSNGNILSPMNVRQKHLSNTTGSDSLYYRYGNTIVRDSGNSDALTVYYYKQPIDLTQGMSSAGGALALTLATTAKAVADYYNGITIENITDGWADTISDYSAARVATLATATGAASKYYGTVSTLPEPFHHLISRRATLILKKTVTSPQRPDMGEVADFREDLAETLRMFAGSSHGDVNLSDLFYNFENYV